MDSKTKLSEYFHESEASPIRETAEYFLDRDQADAADVDSLWNDSAAASMSEDELSDAWQRVGQALGLLPRRNGHRWLTVLTRAAAILFIPLLAAFVYMVVDSSHSVVEADRIVWHDVYSCVGEHIELTLPDSTHCSLNSGSHIRYPEKFGDVRQVFVQGEVFFDVTKDASRPFKVETRDMSVRVYGTRFNIRGYDEEGCTEASLLAGSIGLTPKAATDHGEIMLRPGQKVKVASGTVVVSDFDPAAFRSWTHSSLTFDNLAMREIVRELERLYNVKITVTDDSLLDRRLFVTYAA